MSILSILPLVTSQGSLSVTASTNKTQYSPGENVSVSGKVLDSQSSPLQGAGVSVQINNPQSTPIHVQLVYSDQSGSYLDSFILPANSAQGQYSVFVSASKPGFNNAQTQTQFSVLTQTVSTSSTSSQATTSSSSSSSSRTTSPPPSICFIATATYGSELAPEVALLRNFRDSDVLQTSAGRSFMQAFNAFYYSFSPGVASFIASHNHVRMLLKFVLYPLIGILYLSSRLFGLFSFNSEFAVTLSGIFATLGIGFVYFGPIAIVASRLARRRIDSRYLTAERMIFASSFLSFVGLMLGELRHLPMLLTVAAVGTVLSFLALGGLSFTCLAGRLWSKVLSRCSDRSTDI